MLCFGEDFTNISKASRLMPTESLEQEIVKSDFRRALTWQKSKELIGHKEMEQTIQEANHGQ